MLSSPRILALIAVVLISASAKGATLISDFNAFSSQLLVMNISWSNGVDQYTQGSGFVSITPVNGGNPTGDGSFIASLPGNATLNFTGISLVSLDARVDSGNASSVVKIVFLDNTLTGVVASATFQTSNFSSSFSQQTAALTFGDGNLSMVKYWRIEGDGIAGDAVRYSFDNVSVAAVPEPSTTALGLMCLGLAGVYFFRKRPRLALAKARGGNPKRF